jgi:hypothetical protein
MISDDGCFVLNEILKKSKIEIINLKSKLLGFNKGNRITQKGLEYLEESLCNNKYLKEINLYRNVIKINKVIRFLMVDV